jgi:hypothetical protein
MQGPYGLFPAVLRKRAGRVFNLAGLNPASTNSDPEDQWIMGLFLVYQRCTNLRLLHEAINAVLASGDPLRVILSNNLRGIADDIGGSSCEHPSGVFQTADSTILTQLFNLLSASP